MDGQTGNGVGRSAHFVVGSHGSKPRFRKTSVLDNLMPSRNGLGTDDYERAVYFGGAGSSLGASHDTYQTRNMWLRGEG